MVGKKIAGRWYLRLQKGEEVVSSLQDFCKQNQIQLGTFTGIGACTPVTIGIFLPQDKKYVSKTLTEDMEMTSLLGNVTTMNNEIYIHAHATFAGESLHSYGGHLSSATVSVTAEIVIEPSEGLVDRERDENIGINVWNLL